MLTHTATRPAERPAVPAPFPGQPGFPPLASIRWTAVQPRGSERLLAELPRLRGDRRSRRAGA